MKHRFVILFALGSASACGWLVSACGGGDNTNLDGGNDATTSDTSTTDSPTTDSPVNNDAGNAEAGNPDGGCAKGPGCRTCCAAAYPDAAAFFLAAEETCACTTPGDCKTPCTNSLCKGQPPPQQSQCELCVLNKDAGDCFASAIAACSADPSCQPLEQCVAACGTITDAGGGG